MVSFLVCEKLHFLILSSYPHHPPVWIFSCKIRVRLCEIPDIYCDYTVSFCRGTRAGHTTVLRLFLNNQSLLHLFKVMLAFEISSLSNEY